MEAAPFDRTFYSPSRISRIGGGSIGGKATGLLEAWELLQGMDISDGDTDIVTEVPHSVVVGTSFFDEFMRLNDLRGPALCGMPDERVAHLFQRGHMPATLLGDLRAIASEVTAPMAVRSSSMLEDALDHPFAGVYSTVMIPNNQNDIDGRLKRLCEAIKLVYASTYFSRARRYMKSISRDVGEEKMAILLQEVVGQRRSNRFYPAVSGVGRSHNYYPFGHADRSQGVVELALGLGKTIVDGDGGWCYCPAYPKSPPPFKSVGDMMKQTQTKFWAVNMEPVTRYSPSREDTHLIGCPLSDAEYDGVLSQVASTYDHLSDRVVPGIGRSGPRIITFAPLLTMNESTLNERISALMDACARASGGPVEIEFAVKSVRPGRQSLVLLQARPMSVAGATVELSEEDLKGPAVLVSSLSVLGDGERGDIEDIVYLRPDRFEPKDSARAAMELERVDGLLSAEGRKYLLIGFGRFGTTDPWRGLPVEWAQISSARVIVEVHRKGMETDFSQGSHFFHNMTSFGVCYFSVASGPGYYVDWDWLEDLEASWEGELVRHVRAPAALRMRVDGRSAMGVVTR